MWVLGKDAPLLEAGFEGCVGETMSRMKISQYVPSCRFPGKVVQDWQCRVDGRYWTI